jgi:lia operon protein LiaF
MPLKKKNDFISWMLLIACILLMLEAAFRGGGIVFSVLFCGALIYFGRKRMPSRSGKILFWAGIIILIINILSLFAFRFLLVAGVIYIIVQFYQSKQNPAVIEPKMLNNLNGADKELYEKEPLLKNIGYGRQQTPDHVYEWNDINIQCGVGDSVIDLSETLLPKGESVIFVRGLIGNISIHVPYEIEVAVTHSVMAGSTNIFDRHEPNMFNQTIVYHTKEYAAAEKKVKIVTSLVAGSLEVKWV